ncbi:MAG: hypothetical protein KBB37_10690 [Bacteroidia bacterium]|nr:hypothetical protein [Bacteroidia bacterium]MBP7261744.1 hypothetical protein [Bacteroidia bacterium]MBP9180134.1 hypothetical protein [Bacteroidia bacterium]MBP9725291.1 hypothetical protein [Bacteroidia bacterium]
MKFSVLCNSRLAIPVIQQLAENGQLASCALPDRMHEDNEEISYWCNMMGIPIRTFNKDEVAHEMVSWINLYQPDAVFVLTFPYRIPPHVLEVPSRGFINFHFGRLPEYRGADAIFWQIKNQESMGGISVHQMTPGIDKGPLFFIHDVSILPYETYGSHSNKLALAGRESVMKLIAMLHQGAAPITQSENNARYYKRLTLQDVSINWSNKATAIVALINACNPWNRGAIASIHQMPIRIIAATSQVRKPGNFAIGEVICADDVNGLCIACGNNEQIRADICLINNEFIATPNIHLTGIKAGLLFDNQQHVLQK